MSGIAVVENLVSVLFYFFFFTFSITLLEFFFLDCKISIVNISVDFFFKERLC